MREADAYDLASEVTQCYFHCTLLAKAHAGSRGGILNPGVSEGASPSHGKKSLWEGININMALFGQSRLPQALTVFPAWS